MNILIIQTAFIGDVVLATPLIEKLYHKFPDAKIDFLLRKGNENLLKNHPKLRDVLIFDKKDNKYKNLYKLILSIRNKKYKYVINVQRFFTTGLITVLSKGETTIGFKKNPLSFLFHKKVKHEIKSTKNIHEVNRNLKLLKDLTDTKYQRPILYPSKSDYKKIYQKEEYICIAPSSVWFTKQLPIDKWLELILLIPKQYKIHLLGGPADKLICKMIKDTSSEKNRIIVSAGKYSFLESTALMENAKMNFTNDSGPLHFCSAINANIMSFFCSTLPAFGFGPLSKNSYIAEVDEKLSCRPCGLHGKSACPKGHFNCAKIDMKKQILRLNL